MKPRRFITAIVFVAALVEASPALAHCDALDGPVVKAAMRALDTRQIAHVLVWVQEPHEADVRQAFERTIAVRALSAEGKALADHYFFETVVRLHRTSEGEPYTGLKPAGLDLGPAIPAADKALSQVDVDPVAKLIGAAIDRGLRQRFAAAVAARRFDQTDVRAGRDAVEAYINFLHYVERLYAAASATEVTHEREH